MAEVQEPDGKIRSGSPRHIRVVGVLTEDEEAQVGAGVCALEVRSGGGDEDWGQLEQKWGPEWKLSKPAGPRFQERS